MSCAVWVQAAVSETRSKCLVAPRPDLDHGGQTIEGQERRRHGGVADVHKIDEHEEEQGNVNYIVPVDPFAKPFFQL